METNFNFKSSVCSSREQSERLLALGLKKETADCYLFEYDKEKYKVIAESWLDLIADEKYYSQYKDVCFPAWSLDRLIEMMPEEINRYFCTSFLTLSKHNVYYNESVDGAPDMEFEKNNLYESILNCIEWLIKEGYFNKEYLNK